MSTPQKTPVHPDRNATRRNIGCIAAGIVVALGLLAFVNFTETVKMIGAPFLMGPDALGIVNVVDAAEAISLTGSGELSTFTQSFTQSGPYLIYLVPFEGTDTGSLDITITDSDGTNVPTPLIARGTRIYDSLAVRGFPEFTFTINRPGQYTIDLRGETSSRPNTYTVGIVPDYIVGHEAAFNLAIVVQVVLLIILAGAVYYFRYYRPGASARLRRSEADAKKLNTMIDFMDALHEDEPD